MMKYQQRLNEELRSQMSVSEAVPEVELHWPCWGKPVKLIMDNAKEFRSIALARALELHGIDREYRPAGKPNYGGFIETFWVILRAKFIRLQELRNVADRGTYDSQASAVLTIDAFETWLTAYITGIYHQRIHSSLGMSPIEA